MEIYNLEYRILDKLNRTKSTVHVGVFSNSEAVEAAKQIIYEKNTEQKIAFDIYIIEKPFYTVS